MGLVPFDHSGFYPLAMVVLVACTPLVVWTSWLALARVLGDRLFMVGCGRVTSEPGFLPDVALRVPLVRVVMSY